MSNLSLRMELNGILGYSAEVLPANGTPITAFVTDRSRRPVVDRLVERLAQAWDEGRAAERRDWELTFDLVTPDEERQPLPNPYREVAE